MTILRSPVTLQTFLANVRRRNLPRNLNSHLRRKPSNRRKSWKPSVIHLRKVSRLKTRGLKRKRWRRENPVLRRWWKRRPSRRRASSMSRLKVHKRKNRKKLEKKRNSRRKKLRRRRKKQYLRKGNNAICHRESPLKDLMHQFVLRWWKTRTIMIHIICPCWWNRRLWRTPVASPVWHLQQLLWRPSHRFILRRKTLRRMQKIVEKSEKVIWKKWRIRRAKNRWRERRV